MDKNLRFGGQFDGQFDEQFGGQFDEQAQNLQEQMQPNMQFAPQSFEQHKNVQQNIRQESALQFQNASETNVSEPKPAVQKTAEQIWREQLAGQQAAQSQAAQSQAAQSQAAQSRLMQTKEEQFQSAQFPEMQYHHAQIRFEQPEFAVKNPAADNVSAAESAADYAVDSAVESAADPKEEDFSAIHDRPSLGATIFSLSSAVIFLLAAIGIYFAGVRTFNGQQYDDIVLSSLFEGSPVRDFLRTYLTFNIILVIGFAIGIAGFVMAGVRKQWWCMWQISVFAILSLAVGLSVKRILPRPALVPGLVMTVNSAPSGHTILTASSCVILFMAVPRSWRVPTAIFSAIYTALAGISVVVNQGHRPTDPVMSIFAVGFMILPVFVFTRENGLDSVGTRKSSPAVQIASSVMITGGLCSIAYAAYVISQLQSGLALHAQWAYSPAQVSAIAGICGASSLVFGVILAVRQCTASPLDRMGQVGFAPAPPEK